MAGDLFIHVIHVAGTRMQAEGTDGLSRGDFSMGVMAGQDILTFVPLHLDALQQEPTLRDWVLSWYPASSLLWLSPTNWYDKGQLQNHCVWIPPPAAADIAVELLAKSKHKCPCHQHLIIIPHLLTSRWRKMLSKTCDLVFTVPVGTDVWASTHHEPLLIGVAFPLNISQALAPSGHSASGICRMPLAGVAKNFSCMGQGYFVPTFLIRGGVGPLAVKYGAVLVIQGRGFVNSQ
jgi:hypothetical protein